jgi:low temperature requirement protein LtrA
MVLGGPALYLLGESLFRWRITGGADVQRLALAALLVALAPLGGHVDALPLSIVVAALLAALAVWELRPSLAAADPVEQDLVDGVAGL